MPVDTALVDAVLTPIPGDNPSGKELRYDPRYDQVKEARREDLELPEGGLATDRKLADWGTVLSLGRELVEKESKDLQLAAWLTEGLLKRQGLIGLATGVRVLHGIVDKFWDTCYPEWDEEDPEMRAGPLEWVGTRFDIPVKQLDIAPGLPYLDLQTSRTVPTEGEAESDKEKRALRATALSEGKTSPEAAEKAIAEVNKGYYKTIVADADAAMAALNDLSKACDEKFGRDAPSFLKLSGAVDEVRRQANTILQQKLIDDPDPIVEEAFEEAAAAAGGEEGGVLTPEPVSPADAAARVAVAARYLRGQDPTNPAPYLMLRGLRWGELRAAAQTGEFNPKLLEAAPTAIRSRLKGMLLDGKWPELLEQCESVMATPHGRGWLDLQRYALTACERQGPTFDAVAASIRDALRVLLAAIPTLPEMTLMDDTPTANSETQQWLADEQLLPSDPPEGEAPAEAAAEEGAPAIDEVVVEEALVQEASSSKHGGLSAGPRRRPAPDPFELAKAEVRQGRPKKGFELLLAEVGREQSERGRFLRQVQLAYLMVEGGHDAVARPILERLVATIDEKSLEQWESGPLVAQPMALLVRVLDRAGETESSERYALYQRICKLDTMQAMALQSA